MPILSRSFVFLELLCNSPFQCLWPLFVDTVQHPAWLSREPYDLSGLDPDGPPWAQLSLLHMECLWPPLAVQLPLADCPRTIWFEWTQFRQSRLAFIQIFRLSFFLGWPMLYFILCIHCILFTLHIASCLPMSYSAIIQIFLSVSKANYCQLPSCCLNSLFSIRLLFDYCFIIVNSSDTWKCIPCILFSKTRHNKTVPIIIKYSRANQHHTSQDSPVFVLA